MITPNNRRILYRPTENHLGVVYKAGRFCGFADPDKWRFLVPLLHCIKKEVSLDMQTAEISLHNVMTRDLIAVNLELKVFYKVDLRQTSADFLPQALRITQLPGDIWSTLVRTNVTDVIRNVVFIANDLDYLLSDIGSKHLKRAISSRLSERVANMGIIVKPRFGVSIMNLQPNPIYQDALQKARSATPSGDAVTEYLRSILEMASHQGIDADLALALGHLAMLIKEGKPPLTFMSGDFERGFPWMFGGNGHEREPDPSLSPSGNNGNGSGNGRHAHNQRVV